MSVLSTLMNYTRTYDQILEATNIYILLIQNRKRVKFKKKKYEAKSRHYFDKHYTETQYRSR